MIWNISFRRELTIVIPKTFNATTMYQFINDIFDNNLDARCSSIVFDFSNLLFIEPVGVVVLSNIIESLRKSRVKTSIKNHRVASDANRYLDDSGFFEHYTGKRAFVNAKLRSTTIPLELVANADATSFLYFSLMPWIANQVALSENSLAPLRTSIEEVFHNIRDHSGVGVGCVFAQHFPNKQEIQLAISDFGKGIPNSVRTIIPHIADAEALKQACQEGFTTQSNVRNRGAGLPNLMRYIAQTNHGTVLVSSGNANISATRANETPKITSRTTSGHYPGTLVRAILRTNAFEQVSEDTMPEVFEW